MNNLELVKNKIRENLTDAIVEVVDLTGTLDHLSVKVASNAFKNKMLIDQHQMIMDIFKEELKSNQIHALQVKTLTLDKYNNQ